MLVWVNLSASSSPTCHASSTLNRAREGSQASVRSRGYVQRSEPNCYGTRLGPERTMGFSLRHSVTTRSMAARRWPLAWSIRVVRRYVCAGRSAVRSRPQALRTLSELSDLSGGALRKERTRLRRRSPKRAPFIFVRPLGVSEMSVPLLLSATATGFPLELRMLFRVEPANSARYVLQCLIQLQPAAICRLPFDRVQVRRPGIGVWFSCSIFSLQDRQRLTVHAGGVSLIFAITGHWNGLAQGT